MIEGLTSVKLAFQLATATVGTAQATSNVVEGMQRSKHLSGSYENFVAYTDICRIVGEFPEDDYSAGLSR
jgi:hypothetical protein